MIGVEIRGHVGLIAVIFSSFVKLAFVLNLYTSSIHFTCMLSSLNDIMFVVSMIADMFLWLLVNENLFLVDKRYIVFRA